MTIEAKKRRTMRRSRKPRGDIRRDAAGDIDMIELLAYTRNPLAPRIFVNDVGGIYKMPGGIWRVSFVQKYEGPNGIIEATEQTSLIWPERNWRESNDVFRWVFQELGRGTFNHEGARPGAH